MSAGEGQIRTRELPGKDGIALYASVVLAVPFLLGHFTGRVRRRELALMNRVRSTEHIASFLASALKVQRETIAVMTHQGAMCVTELGTEQAHFAGSKAPLCAQCQSYVEGLDKGDEKALQVHDGEVKITPEPSAGETPSAPRAPEPPPA